MAPQDLDCVPIKGGDCYRGENWVAEVGTITSFQDTGSYRVSYSIMNTIVGGVCSLEEFLERFPHRIELIPYEDLPDHLKKVRRWVG